MHALLKHLTRQHIHIESRNARSSIQSEKNSIYLLLKMVDLMVGNLLEFPHLL